MRIIRSLVTLAAILFLALAIAPGGGQPASASPVVTTAAEPCINHLFGSGSATGGKQVTFRARLGLPAGAGGVVVALISSHASISVPGKVVIPEGSQELVFAVTTQPVATTLSVVVTALTGNCSASKTVTIKAPVLRSISVQSVMSSGSLGKITVCLTGRAAAPVTVNMTSTNPSLIAPASFVVPAGKGCISYKSPVGAVVAPTPVTVTAEAGGVSLSDSTTVKLFIVTTTADE